jgi:hypothetical protein
MPTETFNPAAFGARLQRGYTIVPQWQVAEDQRELGNVKSFAIAQKGLCRLQGLRYHCPTRSSFEYIDSFFQTLVGPAARFNYQLPEFASKPYAAPTLTAVVAGAQGSRTIFAKIAWETASGRTEASPAASLAVPANSLLKVTVPVFPPAVTGAVIYATQGSAGSEVEQTVLTNTTTWTQPDAALLTGTAAPLSANTALKTILAKLVSGTFGSTRLQGQTYVVELELEEVY